MHRVCVRSGGPALTRCSYLSENAMDVSNLTEPFLRQLIGAGEPTCVSIYVPLGDNNAQRDQARIRLKNQLGRVQKALRERGAKPDEIDSLLKPMWTRLETDPLVAGGPGALAFLRSPHLFESLELPESVPEITFVGDRFYVRPLLSLININQRYRVLALSQNDVRLFAGDRYTFHPVHVPDLPGNLKDALYDDDDRHQTLQFHTQSPPSNGDRPAVFHGQAMGQEDTKERILRFCQIVDNAITDHFGDQTVPLILAAAEPLPGVYRQANSYRNLYRDVIRGDPRRLRETDLHKRAWDRVATQARRYRERALGRLNEGLGKSRATTDVAQALDAASRGRVATLFVTTDSGRIGPQGDSTGPDRASLVSTADDPDRVNRTVLETLRHGGRAFAVPRDQMPEHASIAALYRY